MAGSITLLTDFGTRDGYVGALKGVIRARQPAVHIDDIAHSLPPGDVRSAGHALRRYWRLHPPGTVHLVVVDPGVGTGRRGLALEADGRFVVAPDNGCVSGVLLDAAAWRAVEIAGSAPPPGLDPSTTFHGRDVFAPAAARLAGGEGLDALGPPASDLVTLAEPGPSRSGGEARGEVVAVDRFGNLLTNLPGAWLTDAFEAWLGEHRLRTGRTYGEVAPGELIALVNSDGRIEIAARGASASGKTGESLGTPVVLRPKGAGPGDVQQE